MVRMRARYGHFGLEDLRGAVETIGRSPEGKIDQGSPVSIVARVEQVSELGLPTRKGLPRETRCSELCLLF
jgi:hypothetical protein